MFGTERKPTGVILPLVRSVLGRSTKNGIDKMTVWEVQE